MELVQIFVDGVIVFLKLMSVAICLTGSMACFFGAINEAEKSTCDTQI